MTGEDLIKMAQKHVGEDYVLGSLVPKDDENYSGPWDCAEFVSYIAFQATKQLYGCADNLGKPKSADAWTNFFKRDVELGILPTITLAEAKKVAGAVLLRYTNGSKIGHIVFSNGDGKTTEAQSTNTGVVIGVAGGRRWDVAFLLPGVDYVRVENATDEDSEPNVFRYTKPMMQSPKVIELANALKNLGYYKKPVDDLYGPGMRDAVSTFQQTMGLIVDGEAGKQTFEALGLKL